MKTNRSILELGNSKAITLPQEISKKLKVGKKYDFNISLEQNIRRFQCHVCSHTFDKDISQEDLFCPSCSNESKDSLQEVYE